jgi:hypothetical protein
MANMLKGEVPLAIKDGPQLTLVFDHECMIEAESTYGKPLHVLLKEASAGFIGATRALLYGALRAKHPEITLGEVAELIFAHTGPIGDALAKAVELSMPPAAPGSTEGKAKPRRRVGKTSGASGAKPA